MRVLSCEDIVVWIKFRQSKRWSKDYILDQVIMLLLIKCYIERQVIHTMATQL